MVNKKVFFVNRRFIFVVLCVFIIFDIFGG